MPSPFLFRLFVALTLLVAAPLFAGSESILGVERSRIERVIDLGYNLDPAVAGEIEQLKAAYPDSPVPDLLEVGRLYWLQSYAQHDAKLSEQFEQTAETSLEKAERYLKEHPESIDARYVVAMNELSHVIYAVDNKRWWAAFWKSRSALKTMKAIVENDPDYHDAKLSLGMANCYLSRTPPYLKPLAFLMRYKGDWDKGLEYMQDARDHGLFTRVDAAYYLGAIRIELEHDREKARSEFVPLAERYPGNVWFQVMAAQSERSTGQADSARDRLLRSLELPQMETLVAIRMRAVSELCWAALGSASPQVALESSYLAQRLIEEDNRFSGYLPWIKIAQAEALLALGSDAEAIAVLESIGQTEDHAYRKAQERLVALRAK